MLYRKRFIPLESNPDVFNELAHKLGLSPALDFHDVLSLDDPDLLALIPRPALALVLVFPVSPNHEAEIAERDKDAPEYSKSGRDEVVVWYKQTIHNACGLYGLLHAVSNGAARDSIVPNSHLARLLASCEPLQYLDRATVLEEDLQLESVYRAVALQGVTEAPATEEEVDFHYVCFVKSHKNGRLYELDGDRKGPVDRGALDTTDDVLSERALAVMRDFVGKAAKDIGFSLLALAPCCEEN
ncbi:hypothetical protein ACJ41O_007443 [Fusarium nematophilum]